MNLDEGPRGQENYDLNDAMVRACPLTDRVQSLVAGLPDVGWMFVAVDAISVASQAQCNVSYRVIRAGRQLASTDITTIGDVSGEEAVDGEKVDGAGRRGVREMMVGVWETELETARSASAKSGSSRSTILHVTCGNQDQA